MSHYQDIIDELGPSEVAAITLQTSQEAGGEPGRVQSSIYSTLVNQALTTQFGFGITSIAENNSDTADMAAGYFQAITKQAVLNPDGTIHTAGNSVALVGQEIGSGAAIEADIQPRSADPLQPNNLPDHAIGIDVVGAKAPGSAPWTGPAVIDTGIRIGPQGGDPSQAVFGAGITFTGNTSTYQHGQIGVVENTMFAFDTADPLTGIEFFRDSGNAVHILMLIGGNVVQDLHG